MPDPYRTKRTRCVLCYKPGAISVKLRGYILVHFDHLKRSQNMFEINPVKNRIQDLTERSAVLRGYL